MNSSSVTFRINLGIAALWAIAGLAHAQTRIVINGDELKIPKKEVALDALLEPGKLWSQTPETLEKDWKDKGFKWNSEKTKDSGIMRREKWGFALMNLQLFTPPQNVEEVDFQFKDGKLNEVTFAVWNKGDSEKTNLTEADFAKIIQNFTNQLNTKVAPKFEDRGKDTASAAKAERRLWVGKDTLAQIEYSGGREKVRDPFTGREKPGLNFQGEFIRLRLMPKPTSMVGVNASTGGVAQLAKADLSKKIQRTPDGDVFIPGIPMIDQGDKGYCAVATAARVLNYYGIPADQHEMAQVAGNEAGGGGTNPDEMEEALRKLSGKYHITFKEVIDTDYGSHSYQRFLATYNRAAKHMGKRVLDTDNYIYFMGGLDADVLKKVRGEGPVFDKFSKAVHENIDKGVPLLWALQLGKYPENGEKAKQFGGGHMRLIIGYNDSKKEFIFSDSWGAGHEKKRILQADASAATMGLYTVTPAQ